MPDDYGGYDLTEDWFTQALLDKQAAAEAEPPKLTPEQVFAAAEAAKAADEAALSK